MKRLNKLTSLLFLLPLSVAMTSCGSDSSGGDGGGPAVIADTQLSSFIGTEMVTEYPEGKELINIDRSGEYKCVYKKYKEIETVIATKDNKAIIWQKRIAKKVNRRLSSPKCRNRVDESSFENVVVDTTPLTLNTLQTFCDSSETKCLQLNEVSIDNKKGFHVEYEQYSEQYNETVYTKYVFVPNNENVALSNNFYTEREVVGLLTGKTHEKELKVSSLQKREMEYKTEELKDQFLGTSFIDQFGDKVYEWKQDNGKVTLNKGSNQDNLLSGEKCFFNYTEVLHSAVKLSKKRRLLFLTEEVVTLDESKTSNPQACQERLALKNKINVHEMNIQDSGRIFLEQNGLLRKLEVR